MSGTLKEAKMNAVHKFAHHEDSCERVWDEAVKAVCAQLRTWNGGDEWAEWIEKEAKHDS